jgi:hypothetical protein
MNKQWLSENIKGWIDMLKNDRTEEAVRNMNLAVAELGRTSDETITSCICKEMQRPGTCSIFTCPKHGEVTFDNRPLPAVAHMNLPPRNTVMR